MINQAELQQLFNYDPETGIFTRLVRASQCKAGMVAGNPHSCGYLKIQINNKNYLCHRLAWLYMYGYFPKNMIDHINGIKTDNRFINLREATNSQNKFNCSAYKRNKYGAKGVRKKDNRFIANANINNKFHYLGSFKTLEDASKAYQKFCKKNHGEFYREQNKDKNEYNEVLR